MTELNSTNSPIFSTLSLNEALMNNLSSLGYHEMTPIQAQSLPLMLALNDVIAEARTGSGKTAAFGLALLNRIIVERFVVQALVLCPTRELAEQVAQSLRQLARLMPNVKVLNLSGGVPMKAQLDSLRHGAHIIVGTPGRIQKHLLKESLTIDQIRTLVLDEADRMLDMGFLDAIRAILTYCPKKRQTLLFSATFPEDVKQLAQAFMINPHRVCIEEEPVHLDIEQLYFEVEKSEKLSAVKHLLQHYQPGSTLIFCNTKEQTVQLAQALKKEGYSVLALNGDMEQYDRDLAMIRFVNQSCSILIATDVAARGLDIKDLPAVINYDLAFEQEAHTHRIGRTGRAGAKGIALTLTTVADGERLCRIEEAQGQPLQWGNLQQLKRNSQTIPMPSMVTLIIAAGKKDKIRPGDILGALSKDAGLSADMIGKIDVRPQTSYVAIDHSLADKALTYFQNGKLKGKKVLVRI